MPYIATYCLDLPILSFVCIILTNIAFNYISTVLILLGKTSRKLVFSQTLTTGNSKTFCKMLELVLFTREVYSYIIIFIQTFFEYTVFRTNLR